MQKISSYLYSNRVNVIADLACFPVEWRLVYQRTIKLYKGMENVVEFDVRNADQKRLNITGYTMKCLIMDNFNQEILTADVDTNVASCSTGIGVMMVDAADLDYIKPQFLKYVLYILNPDNTKTPVYSDSQFGISGVIDLLPGTSGGEPEPQILDSFIYTIDDTIPNAYVNIYTSDAVEVNPRTDINDQHRINLEFRPLSLAAVVTVQATTDQVVSMATTWFDLEVFNIANTTDRLFKTYSEIEDYSNNIGWLRVKYVPTVNNTGKFDKIIVIS